MKRHSKRRKDPKQLFIAATILAAVAFIAVTYFIKRSDSDLLIAKVNNQKIYKAQIEKKLHEIFDGQNQNLKTPELENLPKEVIEILAKEVYLEKEITARAEKSKAANSQEIKDQINEVKSKIIRQAYIDSLMKDEITDEKINEKYLELTKELEGKKEYEISHILVKTKDQAEKIIKDLQAKKAAPKYEELAKKHSLDQESANKGGSLGYVLEDNMIKEIGDVISSLKKGEVSKPIQTKFGWHVIKYNDVRDAKPMSFESVKDNIKEQLTQDRLNEINAKITKNAQVKILIELKESAEKPAAENKAAEEDGVTEKELKEVNENKPADVSLEPAGKNQESEINSEENIENTKPEVKEEVKKAEKPSTKAKPAKTKNKSDAKHKKDKAKNKSE